MNINKTQSVVFILLLTISMFSLNSVNQISDDLTDDLQIIDDNINQKMLPGNDQKLPDATNFETISNIPEIDNQPEILETTSLTYQDPINIDNWQQGESIRVDHKSRNNTVKSLDYSYKEDTDFILKWGSTGSGNGQFNTPYDIDTNSNGYIFVADGGNQRIQKFDNAGVYISQFGSYGTGDGQFLGVSGIAVNDTGNIYATDSEASRVQKFDSSGTFLLKWGSNGSANGQFYLPQGIAVDSSGNVYVVGAGNNRIQKFDNAGNYLLKWGTAGSGNGQFDRPDGIAIDGEGNVYVTELNNDRVQKFDSTGTFLLKWGTTGTGDGQFDQPTGITIDGSGDIYVTDSNNDRVQKFDNTGTFLLKFGSTGTKNGQFDTPRGITVDSSGDIYISETTNNVVQKFRITTTQVDTFSRLPIAIDQYNLVIANTKSIGLYERVTEKIYIGFTYYDMVSPSKLGISFSWETKKSSILTSVFDTSTQLTLQLSNNAVYSNNELIVDFIFTYSDAEGFTVEIITFDTGVNQYISNTLVSSVNYFDFDNSIIRIDYVWAESQEISSNIRSNLKYSSPTQIVHSLSIDVFDYRIPLAIYSPMSWNLTSITPSATYSWDDTNKYYYITNTIPTTYEILFLSGENWGIDYPRQNQFLAISEVSNNYLQCVSFECGNTGDWKNDNSPTYDYDDNFEISTSIVYEGSFSLYLKDTLGDADTINLGVIDSGEYYISFSYYWITVGTDPRIAVWDETINNWNYINLETSQTNRWINFFGFIHVKGFVTNPDRSLELIISGSNELYFDNFRIWKANGLVSNLEYPSYINQAQFITWDGYNNPAISNLEVNNRLAYRNDDAEILTKTIITDSNGIASYILSPSFQQAEIENRWYSYENWFGSITNDKFGNPNYPLINSENKHYWDYSSGNYEGWSPQGTSDPRQTGYIINNEFEMTASSQTYDWWWLQYDSNTVDANRNWDHSIYNEIIFETKVEDDTWYIDWIDNGYKIGTPTEQSFTGTLNLNLEWTYNHIKLDSVWIDSVWTNKTIRFAIKDSDGTWVNEKMWFDNIKLVGNHFFSPSYFTPLPASYSPYSYETKQDKSNNYWDFSENSWEYDSSSSWSWEDYETIENGQMIVSSDSTRSYIYMDYLHNDAIDMSFYTHLIIRFKMNSSMSDLLDVVISSNLGLFTSPGTSYNLEFPTDFMILEIDLSLDPDWGSGAMTYLRVQFSSDSGANWSDDTFFWIDYIRLLHLDTSHSQGYAWEFEEPNYMDGFTEYVSNTVTVKNGYAEIQGTGGNGWLGLLGNSDIYSNMDTTVTDYILIRYKHFFSSGGSIVVQINSINQYITLTGNLNTWQTIIVELNTKSSTITDFYIFFVISPDPPTTESGMFDYIRLVDISNSNGLYETDEYFYFQSENNTLAYNVWMDNQDLGLYYDQENIWKNASKGTHSISYITYTSWDPTESRYEFVHTPATIYYYNYTILDEFIVQVHDFSLSDNYVQTYVVASKKYSYTIKENGSTIATGSGLAEGTSIQSTRDNTPGVLINYVIEFINGTDTITFTTSYSNAATIPGAPLTVEYFVYDINDATFSVMFGTNWANQTAIIYQNSSNIGSVQEDTVTVFDRNLTPDTYYNVTITIGSFIYQFGYKNAPITLESDLTIYYASVAPYAGAVEVYTNWGNTTLTVYDNSSSLGSGSEGLLLISFDISTPGLHNISIKVDGTTQSLWLFYDYSVAFADPDPTFELQYIDFSYDAAAAKIYFSWFSNWGNTTATIKDNSTNLGSGSEESVSVSFIDDYGLHNITILINNSNTILVELYTSFTISPTLGIYEVWIDLFDGIGLGLDFETVAVYANVSGDLERVGKSFLWPNNSIELIVKDFFGVTLNSVSQILMASKINYVGISVPIFTLTLLNPYPLSVKVIIERAANSMTIVVPANSSFSIRLSTGVYIFQMKPVYDHPNYTDPYIGNEPPRLYVGSQDSYSHSKVANYKLLLEPTADQRPKELTFFTKIGNWFDKISSSRAVKLFLFVIGLLGAAFTIRRLRLMIKKKGIPRTIKDMSGIQ